MLTASRLNPNLFFFWGGEQVMDGQKAGGMKFRSAEGKGSEMVTLNNASDYRTNRL